MDNIKSLNCFMFLVPCSDMPYDNKLSDIYETLDRFSDGSDCYYISNQKCKNGRDLYMVITIGYVLTNVVLIKTKLGGYNLTKLDFKTLKICIDAFNVIIDTTI